MSAEEFWHGDFRLAGAYREADRIRRDNRYAAEWRAGVYMFEALLTASPAFRELSGGIDHEYPPEPIFSAMTAAEREAREAADEERRAEEMIERFKRMALEANARLAERESAGDGE
ncbi:hypothetical protein VJ923_07315 [Adlercreutzia sp. R25]|uniref:hypothetical protein n=1 Tax=Adlercreutzia shanghongiae TaxID=3111773 RepID=UPI002DBC8FB3|nr:hypothetical protein [Adlercreutzia sp. R25]MEC4272963.1 hypothetical protein [Adlercreutzia sp. R25]